MEELSTMTYDYETRASGYTHRDGTTPLSDKDKLSIIRLYAKAVWMDVYYFTEGDNINEALIIERFCSKLREIWDLFFPGSNKLKIIVVGHEDTHLKFIFQTDKYDDVLYRGFVERYPLSPTMTAIKRKWNGFSSTTSLNRRGLLLRRNTDGLVLPLSGWRKLDERNERAYEKLVELYCLYDAGYTGPCGKYFKLPIIDLPINAPTSAIVKKATEQLENVLSGCHVYRMKYITENKASVSITLKNENNFTSMVKYLKDDFIRIKSILDEFDKEVILEMVLVVPKEVKGVDIKRYLLEMLERRARYGYDADLIKQISY